jgi:hypothetical protein
VLCYFWLLLSKVTRPLNQLVSSSACLYEGFRKDVTHDDPEALCSTVLHQAEPLRWLGTTIKGLNIFLALIYVVVMALSPLLQRIPLIEHVLRIILRFDSTKSLQPSDTEDRLRICAVIFIC